MNVLHVRVSDALHGAVQAMEKEAKNAGVEVGELHERLVQMGADSLNALGLEELAKHIEKKRQDPVEPAPAEQPK